MLPPLKEEQFEIVEEPDNKWGIWVSHSDNPSCDRFYGTGLLMGFEYVSIYTKRTDYVVCFSTRAEAKKAIEFLPNAYLKSVRYYPKLFP